MASTPLRLGIIGCGNVLDAYAPQCEKLRQRGLAEVVVGCGRKSQEARAVDLGIHRFTTGEAEVIESPEVDIVVVLAPMLEHARLARAALRAGKHVLLEKPLATNLEEAGELLELARRVDRRLVCAPFTTLSPTFQAMAARIGRGDIGRVCSARARYGWSGPWWNAWFYRAGGGCLFDLGVYCITSLTGLLGPAVRVSAMMAVAIPERQVEGQSIRVEADDNAQVLLEFQNGALGVVTTGFVIQQYRCPALEVYGTSGTLQMLGDDWDPDGYELWQNSAACWSVFKETHPDWSWTDGLRDLVESLQSGRTPQVKAEHAYHVLEIMLAAKVAAREGRACPVRSRFELEAVSELQAGEAAHLVHDRSREHR